MTENQPTAKNHGSPEHQTFRTDRLCPFRTTPETTRRIMRTTLAALCLPSLAAVLFFGFQAAKLIAVAALAGGVTEILANRFRRQRQPGSTTHSVMMGVLVAFTLPADASWRLAVIGAVVAVLIGKVFFGGLGNYVWHPALIGRLALQLFFSEQLSPASGALLSREQMFLGDIHRATTHMGWFNFNWFTAIAPTGSAGFVLPEPLTTLREFSNQAVHDGSEALSRYLMEKLPPLDHCMMGAVPGGLGETCRIALMLVVLYLMYRGYVRWQMPAVFIGAAFVTALLCPVPVNSDAGGITSVVFPLFTENLAVGFTYAHYHIFSGSLLAAAFLFTADMTSRPITLTGQIIFAAGAGILTIVLRLYSPIAIPAYAAFLILNTLTATLDRLTRPRGKVNIKI